MPTKQETFDKTVAHLRKQGRRAIDPETGQCMYRAPDGCMCAAGCHIPDDRYDPCFEDQEIEVSSDSELTRLMRELGHDIELLVDLRNVHDNRSVREWEEEFSSVAKKHNLTYTPRSE